MGDIYLYQSNYLVLFYKTFSTSYSYTELGKLKDPTDLDTLIGSNNVEVQWFKNNTETEETTKETTKDTTEDTTPIDSFQKNGFPEYMKINYIIWLLLASILF